MRNTLLDRHSCNECVIYPTTNNNRNPRHNVSSVVVDCTFMDITPYIYNTPVRLLITTHFTADSNNSR